ncbi:MAG: oxygen-dependent coproporphyrinogen oxidase [Candidatus Liberibacter europaeus]|uniref:coproporphyrinogen oxidase n=1 Tax=Candidatus Liberibacter europaeus TaxID=744859 RepID=A0A2T4VWG7_9HYPH|nr:oxygen-dependent coproporphyrinogen oxidase [Candidatus Liberibacter europaeus]PTL86128.1 MAG: oxygen-dependent coproporphyrinogen oxidase [Candidatus Liberibacter europaeus]
MSHHEIKSGFPDNIEEKKIEVQKKFQNLQKVICSEFEKLENECHKYPSNIPARLFKSKKWLRDKNKTKDLGGGHMATLSGGCVFEKASVLRSTVYGELSQDFRNQIPGTLQSPKFWATGLSVIAHPYNPHVPAIHMNTRMMITNSYWFGGGIDLTPFLESRRKSNDPDVVLFHDSLKKLCNLHKVSDYERYKKWCDQYFFLPHRQESRGVGGIFFDYLHSNEIEGGIDADFSFISSLGDYFIKIYPLLVRRSYRFPFTQRDRQEQLMRRGRYVEFNLLYDRGTSFGLKTGGNIESIFSSMPPMVSWL